MKIKSAIRKYLNSNARTMQIATVGGDQPWICTVWFVVDEELNLYWLSYPTRRHSRELINHPKIAAAIVVNPEMPTVGIQIEGIAEKITDIKIVQKVMKTYVAKYGEGKDYAERFETGTNKHVLFRLKPKMFVLIDDVNFAEEGRIEWRP